MQELRHGAKAEGGGLLHFLLVWRCAVSAGARECGMLRKELPTASGLNLALPEILIAAAALRVLALISAANFF